jgi:hypothetical protein
VENPERKRGSNEGEEDIEEEIETELNLYCCHL